MNDTGRRPWRGAAVIFLIGIVVGGVGAVLLPKLLEQRLPALFGGEQLTMLTGEVRAKQVDLDRLLLTVPTEHGTVLAAFTRRINEIDLLVSDGDSVSLVASGYQPFIENPEVAWVRTPRLVRDSVSGAVPARPSTPRPQAPDSAAAGKVQTG